jgi:peptidylprolyl isomerase
MHRCFMFILLALAVLRGPAALGAEPDPSPSPSPTLNPAIRAIIVAEDARNAHIIERWARHGEVAVRLRAATALGRIQDINSLPSLERLASDADPRVKSAAIFAIGQMWNAAAEPVLLNIWVALPKTSSDQTGIVAQWRMLTLEALGKCATPNGQGWQTMLAGLGDSDAKVRAMAAQACGVAAYRWRKDGGTRWSLSANDASYLIARLKNDHDAVRSAAAYALYRAAWMPPDTNSGSAKPPEWRDAAQSALTVLAARGDVQCRINAVEGLGAIGALGIWGDPAVTAGDTALADKDWHVRAAACEALAKSGAPANSLAVARLLSDPVPLVTVAALRALRQIGNPDATAAVDGVWKDARGSKQIRAEALLTLAKLQGAQATALLDRAAKHPDWMVRKAAAESWKDLQGANQDANFTALLADTDPRVRAAAVETLGNSSPSSASLLHQAMNDRDMVVRAAAAEALAKQGDRDGVPPIMDTLARLRSDSDGEIMQTLVESLGKLKDTRAVPVLETYATDADVTLARSAASALTEITGQPHEAHPGTPRSRLTPDMIDWAEDAVAKQQQGFPPIVILHTDRGDLTIACDAEEAPFTVWNFVRLARSHFYNGQLIHRVVPNFVTQGGDPRGDGWGGPGYAIRCEYNPLRYDRGAVGMALAGKDTGGSQFFITHSAQPHLNGRYTLFGHLVKGDDVLETITEGDRILYVEVKAP